MPKDRPLTVPYPPAVTRWPKAAPAAGAAVLAPPFRTDNAKVAPFVPRSAPATAAPSESWENMSEEGVAEAAFEEDVARASDGMKSTEFPFDAFIIPEHSQRIPTGLDAAQIEAVTQHTEHPDQDAKHDLADRLEKLSRRLRSEDVSSLLEDLARGDRVDHLIAPVIASYFSKKNA